MDDADLDYARGLALVTAGAVPDVLVRSAARLAPSTEAPAIFGPGEAQRDGWTVDAAGQVWTPPVRDRPFEPVRSSAVLAAASDTSSTAAVPSSSRPTPTVDLAKQRTAAARLPDQRLAELIRESERWERWCTDPGPWRWRWDRRVLYIGRALRAEGAP